MSFFNWANSKQRNIIITIDTQNTSKIYTHYKYALKSSHRNILEKNTTKNYFLFVEKE
jgi:hypothetical protein